MAGRALPLIVSDGVKLSHACCTAWLLPFVSWLLLFGVPVFVRFILHHSQVIGVCYPVRMQVPIATLCHLRGLPHEPEKGPAGCFQRSCCLSLVVQWGMCMFTHTS